MISRDDLMRELAETKAVVRGETREYVDARLGAVKDELRTYLSVAAESLEDDIKRLADATVSLAEKQAAADNNINRLDASCERLDLRVLAIEARLREVQIAQREQHERQRVLDTRYQKMVDTVQVVIGRLQRLERPQGPLRE